MAFLFSCIVIRYHMSRYPHGGSSSNPYSNMYGGAYQQPLYDRNKTIDIKEIQKKEIYKQGGDFQVPQLIGSPYISNYDSSNSKCDVGLEDVEIFFDSVVTKDVSNIDNGEITYDISGVNNGFDIKNFVQMSIEPFWFPIPLIGNDPALPDPYFFRTVYMQILNLPDSTAIKASNGNRFHFEFSVSETASIAILLTPKKTTSALYLTKPMIGLSQLQVRFMIPPFYRGITLPQTVVVANNIGESNPGQFVLQGTTTDKVFGPVGVPPAPGIALFGSGFNSVLKPSVNPIVNNPQGIFITEIFDGTRFQVAGANFHGAGDNIPATFIVGKNRIAFSMRFTSVTNNTTNYLSGVHV